MEVSPYSAPGLEMPIDIFIEQQVLNIFGLTLDQIMIKCREKRLVVPRQAYVAAMCRYNKNTQWGMSVLLYDRFQLSYDHSTINHAEVTIEEVYLPGKVSNATDKVYAKKVQEFFAIIQSEYDHQQTLKNEKRSRVSNLPRYSEIPETPVPKGFVSF
jgi:hypothetical protein